MRLVKIAGGLFCLGIGGINAVFITGFALDMWNRNIPGPSPRFFSVPVFFTGMAICAAFILVSIALFRDKEE